MPRLYWTRAARHRVLERYRTLLLDCPVPYEQRHVATCLGDTHVLSCGPDPAPPLVLLHGGNTNSLMWLRSLPAWTQRFRVHAVDVIGDPGFSAPVRPAFHTDAHARWLDDVWRALDIERAAVVAASLGGWIALDYVIRRPGKVERLALLAPAGIVRMDPFSQLKAAGLTLLGARGRRAALEYAFGADMSLQNAASRDFVEFQGLVQTNFLSRVALPAMIEGKVLRGISTPVFVVLGEKDVFFRADRMQQRLASCLPSAEIQQLPGVGHGLGDPTESVTGFLARTYVSRLR